MVGSETHRDSGLVQRNIDTLKNADKSTFEVYNLKMSM